MENNIEKYASELLLRLGQNPYSNGYRYSLAGVMLIYDSRNTYRNFSGKLYPEIAARFNTTPAAVERAIRHAVHTSWFRREKKLSAAVFLNSLQSASDIPTNTLYLSAAAEWLRLNYAGLAAAGMI